MTQKNKIQQDFELILRKLRNFLGSMSIGDIEKSIEYSIHKKTLQRRLKSLIDEGLVIVEGKGRNQKYLVNKNNNAIPTDALILDGDKTHPIFSSRALSLLSYLDTPSYGRAKTSYQAELIENYIPNETQYVSNTIREQLYKSGKRLDITLAAGTYAKHIGQRLLIDLSYHSSRLEGNTYSKLDTKKFIENGLTAEGKAHEETVMIMNHKEAILFLVENAEELSLSLFTIRNIHYLLSQDLLRNPNACGKIRQIEVRVGKSAYLPLNNSHQLESHFALLLRKAEQITDPFEQSFFLLMHISYLQAFEDVNKRTARLSCNIPFIKENLCPLSFIDVPQKDYFAVLIYFYEKNDLQPALELFQWAYIKSCEQYDVVKESLGEIDTYRIQYRSARKEIMGKIIRQGISHSNIESAIAVYCRANSIDSPDKFITMTMQDLENLHVGAIIGLGITESMYASWKAKNSIQK
jgi:Fic family protein